MTNFCVGDNLKKTMAKRKEIVLTKSIKKRWNKKAASGNYFLNICFIFLIPLNSIKIVCVGWAD